MSRILEVLEKTFVRQRGGVYIVHLQRVGGGSIE